MSDQHAAADNASRGLVFSGTLLALATTILTLAVTIYVAYQTSKSASQDAAASRCIQSVSLSVAERRVAYGDVISSSRDWRVNVEAALARFGQAETLPPWFSTAAQARALHGLAERATTDSILIGPEERDELFTELRAANRRIYSLVITLQQSSEARSSYLGELEATPPGTKYPPEWQSSLSQNAELLLELETAGGADLDARALCAGR